MFDIKVYNSKGLVDIDELNKEFNKAYKILSKSNLNGEMGCRYVVSIDGHELDYRISLIIRSDKSHNIKVDYIPTNRNITVINESLAGKIKLPPNYLFIIEDHLNNKLRVH